MGCRIATNPSLRSTLSVYITGMFSINTYSIFFITAAPIVCFAFLFFLAFASETTRNQALPLTNYDRDSLASHAMPAVIFLRPFTLKKHPLQRRLRFCFNLSDFCFEYKLTCFTILQQKPLSPPFF